MKQLVKVIVAVGLVFALATSANAALTPATIPGLTGGTNDFSTLFSGAGTQIGGYFGGQLYLNSGGPTSITMDYFGAEASFHNEFNFNGLEVFAHGGGTNIAGNALTPLDTDTDTANPGLLDFSFDYNSDAGSVVNGSNPNNAIFNLPNFFVSFNPYSQLPGGPTSGQSVWLFLDDGATSDDNHDDFLVKLSITGGSFSVPEPSTLLLLGSGLLGLVGLGRRRTK